MHNPPKFPPRARLQDKVLDAHLTTLLGNLDGDALASLRSELQWVELDAGETLMSQGEPGDSMYLSISGRLRAYVRDDEGQERMVREMARGQIIGEMALYTDEPRSATVVAIRDSVLVRLDKAAFTRLLSSSAQVSVALTRQMIKRLQTVQLRSDLARPVTIGLMPITAGVDAAGLTRALADQLVLQLGSNKVCVVDAARVDRVLNEPGLAQRSADDADANRRIALHLEEVEAEFDYVLLLADDQPTPWTRRCSRRCDEMLLLANADKPAELHPSEQQFMMTRNGRAEAAEILVLLHPAQKLCPSGTRHWLARRPLSGHVHIRPTLERDLARLARLQSRTAVGLVLAGGGARGLSHLGLFRALHEQGIEVDWVGGTSIGAVMSVLAASDQPVDRMIAVARHAFGRNPTGDFNPFPLLSMIRGRRLQHIVRTAIQELTGAQGDMEDLWKNCYCVASNYSQASEKVIAHGPLLQSLLASAAIPGALPPVLSDGDMLCDGGSFNNFPVDVMRGVRGVGKVIGMDLSYRRARRIDLDEVPSAWALLLDRLRPRKRRRYRFPSLVAYLMNVTLMYSNSRQRQARKLIDLYFNPSLDRVGLLQWNRFDHIVAQGLAHGQQVLAEMSPEALQPYRGARLPAAAPTPAPIEPTRSPP
jgi:NTE family protein